MVSQRMKIEEFAALLQKIILLRNRFKAILPDDLAQLKKQIDLDRLQGRTDGIGELNQLYAACLVLSRNPGPLTMGELSRGLEVPLSTATRIMDWFVGNGYVVRLPDPEDRRVVRVALTAAGEDLYRTINSFVVDRVVGILDQFSPEDQDMMIRLLRKLIGLLETETTSI